MALPSGFEPELMVPKTIVLSITPRKHIFVQNYKYFVQILFNICIINVLFSYDLNTLNKGYKSIKISII